MSIKVGQKIEIRPNMRYKDKPELNEDIGYGQDQVGVFQQCQVLDRTDVGDGKIKTGFLYVRIHTDLPLKVGDMVTVKEFEYVQRKGNLFVIGIKIEETSPFSISDDQEENENDCAF